MIVPIKPMDNKEQIEIFSKRLDALIDSTAAEFNLTYAEAIGVMMIKIHVMSNTKPKEEK